MYTIGQLGRRFGLSRSTLLHYDAIGLLQPSGRSGANYRLYTEADAERLDRITAFREAGLALKVIGTLIDDMDGATAAATLSRALEQRLTQINSEIRDLRRQQQVIVQLLGKDAILPPNRLLDKAQWVELLRATGLDDKDMEHWHAEFELRSPEAHQDFLEALGIPEEEIRTIRKLSLTG
jgi:DNA-binding transcriptional MerR regulator